MCVVGGGERRETEGGSGGGSRREVDLGGTSRLSGSRGKQAYGELAHDF